MTGCRVSYEHLSHSNPVISSFKKFHVYYQIRRLLKEASCPVPFQNFWSAFENNIHTAMYRKICRDFHVSPVSNWRQLEDNNLRGLGIAAGPR